jgi:hypothetical protein
MFSGEQRPELQDPSLHGFARDIKPALSEQIFDVAITECQPHIEPDTVPDDLRRKLVAGNEIVIRHLSLQTETRYRCCDKVDARVSSDTTLSTGSQSFLAVLAEIGRQTL